MSNNQWESNETLAVVDGPYYGETVTEGFRPAGRVLAGASKRGHVGWGWPRRPPATVGTPQAIRARAPVSRPRRRRRTVIRRDRTRGFSLPRRAAPRRPAAAPLPRRAAPRRAGLSR